MGTQWQVSTLHSYLAKLSAPPILTTTTFQVSCGMYLSKYFSSRKFLWYSNWYLFMIHYKRHPDMHPRRWFFIKITNRLWYKWLLTSAVFLLMKKPPPRMHRMQMNLKNYKKVIVFIRMIPCHFQSKKLWMIW